ncbi:MAG TPA: hypothetical protein PLP25_10040 [Candidatus Limiplasma sp.]|nr:hypothetical protein [Candidatus Limiplasma sp.]HPS82180.1 hypothetical protein [Candidatus Limiplasma sp.]
MPSAASNEVKEELELQQQVEAKIAHMTIEQQKLIAAFSLGLRRGLCLAQTATPQRDVAEAPCPQTPADPPQKG